MFSRLTSFILGWNNESPDVEAPPTEPTVITIEDFSISEESEEIMGGSLPTTADASTLELQPLIEEDFNNVVTESEDNEPEPEAALCQYEVSTLPEPVLCQAELFCGDCGTQINTLENSIWFCIECDLYYMMQDDEVEADGGFCTCGTLIIPCDFKIESCEEGCSYWFEGEYEESLVVVDQEDDLPELIDCSEELDVEDSDVLISRLENSVEPSIDDFETVSLEDEPLFLPDENDLDAELDEALAELDAIALTIPAPAPTPVEPRKDRRELTKEEFEERIESILRELWPEDDQAYPNFDEDIWNVDVEPDTEFALPSISVVDQALEEYRVAPAPLQFHTHTFDPIWVEAPATPEVVVVSNAPEEVPVFPKNFEWPVVEHDFECDWPVFDTPLLESPLSVEETTPLLTIIPPAPPLPNYLRNDVPDHFDAIFDELKLRLDTVKENHL